MHEIVLDHLSNNRLSVWLREDFGPLVKNKESAKIGKIANFSKRTKREQNSTLKNAAQEFGELLLVPRVEEITSLIVDQKKGCQNHLESGWYYREHTDFAFLGIARTRL